MSNLNDVLNNFLNEEPIIIYKPIYAQMFGSVGAGLLASDLIYWSKTMKHGQFYKTDEDLCIETGMKIKQLRAAKKEIIDSGVFSIEVKSLPARTFYQIHLDKLINLIKKHAKKKGKQVRLKQANRFTRIRKTSCPKVDNQSAEIRHATSSTTTSINTETNTITKRTREATSEIEVIEPPKTEPSIDLTVDHVCDEPSKAVIPHAEKTKVAVQQKFELFWLAYVQKNGKGAARKAFDKALKKTSLEVILAALEAQNIERAHRATLGLWSPNWKHPATWLNQECWNDVPKTVEEMQKEVQANQVVKNAVGQKKPSHADRVEAANRAMGSIMEEYYPDMLKHFPELMPEPKLPNFNVPKLREEVVINAI